MKQETLEEKLDKIVSKEPSKFWAESDERFKNKETLEETIERLFRHYPESIDYIKAFVNGAKWQQERSYSEEDMLQAFEFYAERAICDIKYLDDDFTEFIKQLKKEQNESKINIYFTRRTNGI